MSLRRWAGAVLVVMATGTAVAGPVAADVPVPLVGQITDETGALGTRRAEVQQALDRLNIDQRVQLFVVYVNDFSGRTAADWATETARLTGLGRRDLLLAVATGARQYYISADNSFALSDQKVDDVAGATIEPKLQAGDWAGAAIGAANGFGAALGAPATGSSAGSSPLVWLLPIGGGLVLLPVLFYMRNRRRTTPRTPVTGPAAPRQLTLAELDAKAGHLLVAGDDAIKTSVQELGFAEAQFGTEPTRPFAAAVVFAKEQVTAAFRLRQQLDDAYPEDDATRRAMLEEIISRCEQAGTRLDTESAAFDRLRDLEANAPQVLAETEAAHARVSARVEPARSTLAALAGVYAPSAFETVAQGPDEARDRLEFAAGSLARARSAVDQGDRSQAAVLVHAGESSVDQAAQLLDAVEHRERELAEAAKALDAALQDTLEDLAAARTLINDERYRASLAPQVARAEAATERVRQDLAAGRYDPIAELKRVEEANAALDQAMNAVKDDQGRQRGARSQLDQAMLTARSQISAGIDFITTHRGAVGSSARTRLAEAQRHLAQAEELAGSDAAAALSEARQAGELAAQAIRLAQDDVGGYQGGMPYGGGRNSMGGVILGGILIDGMLRGGRGGGFGGGGGFGPGSFGGMGTGGRRGSGGAF